MARSQNKTKTTPISLYDIHITDVQANTDLRLFASRDVEYMNALLDKFRLSVGDAVLFINRTYTNSVILIVLQDPLTNEPNPQYLKGPTNNQDPYAQNLKNLRTYVGLAKTKQIIAVFNLMMNNTHVAKQSRKVIRVPQNTPGDSSWKISLVGTAKKGR